VAAADILGGRWTENCVPVCHSHGEQIRRNEVVPEALDQTILNELRHLINEKLVEISDVTRELPYYIALPQAKQDVEKARRLMIKDGFIPGN
jgi:hypothetical protein